MPESSLPDALAESMSELERLLRERQQLDIRIAKMQQVVAALRSVARQDDDEAVTTSLTNAVRTVLRGASDRGLSPTEIREGMLAMGFDLSRYAQPLAMIHVIIRRLEKNDEVMEIGDSGNKRYWWMLNGEPPRPSAQTDAAKRTGRRRMTRASAKKGRKR